MAKLLFHKSFFDNLFDQPHTFTMDTGNYTTVGDHLGTVTVAEDYLELEIPGWDYDQQHFMCRPEKTVPKD
jgi:hypothetical protein